MFEFESNLLLYGERSRRYQSAETQRIALLLRKRGPFIGKRITKQSCTYVFGILSYQNVFLFRHRYLR